MEKFNNDNFKGVEFDTFKNEAGSNKFKISLQNMLLSKLNYFVYTDGIMLSLKK